MKFPLFSPEPERGAVDRTRNPRDRLITSEEWAELGITEIERETQGMTTKQYDAYLDRKFDRRRT